MLTSLLVALSLSQAPAPELQVLVLTTGQRMTVRSYQVAGRVLKIVGADGSPLVMRAELVDIPASEAATVKARERVAAAAEAAARAEEEAAAVEAERLATREAANERTRAQSEGKRGTISTASGSARRETAAPEPAAEGEALQAGPAVPQSGEAKEGVKVDEAAWAARLATARGKWREANATSERLIKEHDALADEHNRSTNYAERRVMETQIADLRERIKAAQLEPGKLERDYKRLQGEAQRAGVPQRTYGVNVRGGTVSSTD